MGREYDKGIKRQCPFLYLARSRSKRRVPTAPRFYDYDESVIPGTQYLIILILLQMLLHNIINVSMYSRCKPVLSLT